MSIGPKESEGAPFAWADSDEAVIFPSVKAVAVYTNVNGEIVIRQHGFPEDDAIVIIPPVHVEAIIKALQRELMELGQEY